MSEIKTPPRRLVDLNPEWIMNTDGKVYGISYDCPCGLPPYDPANGVPWEQCCRVGGRQVVPTKVDFAGDATSAPTKGWDLTGDSFENITLAPSIHQVGHWHGFLKAGVLESC